MATNKRAIIRYRVIDKCLRQTDRAWNWKTLAEACAMEIEKSTGMKTTLSERTIKGDLMDMRNDEALGYYAPIEYDRKEKSYYYSRRDYSITESPLNKSDSTELKGAIDLLQQFTGFKHLEGLDNIIKKLELLAYESTTQSERIVHLAQPTSIPGQKWLDILYNAIKNKKSLLLTYQPFGKKASAVIMSPYLLKEFDNRWYLYGFHHEKKQIRTYGLERINELKHSLQDYIPNIDFDAESYFDNIIGITLQPNKKIKKIQFEVYNPTVNYIRTKPLHYSQIELEKTKEKSVFQIEVIPNIELESQILSYGESIKVIKPKTLSDRLKKRLTEASSNYH
jgi:predicted DNA-binding transcriptional regulator YafY